MSIDVPMMPPYPWSAWTKQCVDRLYLNACVPLLQTGAGAAWFFREVRGNPVPSSALMAPMTRRFVTSLERFARDQGVDVITFRKGERKDDVTQRYLRDWSGGEGVLSIGKAQEKARVLRTEKRRDPVTGRASPELVSSTAMVNAWSISLVDDDFGTSAPASSSSVRTSRTTPGSVSTVTST